MNPVLELTHTTTTSRYILQGTNAFTCEDLISESVDEDADTHLFSKLMFIFLVSDIGVWDY
jgi:hypothetical protein